jgi:hypothetical protein
MLGWALSAAIILSLVAVGFGALWAPRPWASLYGIVLDDRRALAFIRAMGVRDIVIGGLLAVIAYQRARTALGWGLFLTAVVALADYVIVAADRRAATPGSRAHAMDTRVLHATSTVGLVVAACLLLAGY